MKSGQSFAWDKVYLWAEETLQQILICYFIIEKLSAKFLKLILISFFETLTIKI